MIYKGEFSDYNNNKYTVLVDSHKGRKYPSYEQIDFTHFDGSTDTNGWQRWRFDEIQPSNEYSKFNDAWDSYYVNRQLPSCSFGWVFDTRYSDNFDLGDEVEIEMFVDTSFDCFGMYERCQGVYFGKMGNDGTLSEKIDLNIYHGNSYTFTTRLDASSTMFRFVLDRPQINQIYVTDIRCYNKTKNLRFTLMSRSNGWLLNNYYYDGHKLGDWQEYIPSAPHYDAMGRQFDVYSETIQNPTYWFDGWCYRVFLNPSWDYAFDEINSTNSGYEHRFPNYRFIKDIRIRKGESYRISFNYGHRFRDGYWLKFYSGDKEVYAEKLQPSTGYDHTVNYSNDITFDVDVDKVMVGNDDGSNFCWCFWFEDFKIEHKTYVGDTQEITLGGTPFVTEVEGDEEDIFKPIKTSTATLNLVSEKYLFDLYSTKDDIDVTLYDSDNNIKWIGLVKPLIFNQGYNQWVEEIEVECVDYLTILNEIHLSDRYIIENKPVMRFGDLIGKILYENTRYKNVYVADLFYETMMTIYSASTSTFIDDDCKIKDGEIIYADKNWTLYQIIESMMRYMGLTMFADGENLICADFSNIKQDCDYYKYEVNSNGLVEVERVKLNNYLVINDIYDSSDLQLLPVLKNITVKTKTKKIESVLGGDVLDDKNLQNITLKDVVGEPTFNMFDGWEQYIYDVDGDDNKKYHIDYKIFKSKLHNFKNFTFNQNPSPTTQGEYDSDNIYPLSDDVTSYTGMSSLYTGEIMDFRTYEVDPTHDDEYDGVNAWENWFSSHDLGDFKRYLVIYKGEDKNNKLLAQELPAFKFTSEEFQMNNKMALKFNANLLNVPYLLGTLQSEGFSHLYERVPIERDFSGFTHIGSPHVDEKYFQANTFANIGIEIKVGDYYWTNVAYNSGGELYYHRLGYWTKKKPDYVNRARLQFDSVKSKYAFGKNLNITDTSKDPLIEQDDAGMWVMFNADERTYGGEEHNPLPESMHGRIEITIFPNCQSGRTSPNKTEYNFGCLAQFLGDFDVKLVIPKSNEMSDEDMQSETEISAFIDEESFGKDMNIDFNLHSDFKKVPSCSTVILDEELTSQEYTIKGVNEEAHLPEEWCVYRYTNQYKTVRKLLTTSLKEDVNAISLAHMNGRSHFGDMLVIGYEKDWRTGFSETKLVEIQ